LHAIFKWMKRILLLFFLILFQNILFAQIHEVGVFLGGSNYVGDVGRTNFVYPNEFAFGFIYKWNKSPRHSYRFSYTQGGISGNDLNADNPGRTLRGYNFKNNIKEFSAGLEFNFFNFNLHESLKKKTTPYVYSGLSYFAYDELFVVNGETKRDYTNGAFAIPMVVGIKSNIITNIVLAFEVGARYTFTDNLDGSNPKNPRLTTLKFGNINSNDWYVFSGFTLTYTFGEKPCYCSD